MAMLSELNKLRKAPDGLNPVAMGWAMTLGVLCPVSVMALLIVVFSVFLVFCGIDPTVLILTCLHQMAIVLTPLVEVLSAAWLAYTLSYFVIAVVATGVIRGLHAFPIVWVHAGDSLLTMQIRILEAWQNVVTLSAALLKTYLRTDSLRAFSDGGLPSHLSTGWRPSVNPQLA